MRGFKTPIFDVTDKNRAFDFVFPFLDKIEDNFVHIFHKIQEQMFSSCPIWKYM